MTSSTYDPQAVHVTSLGQRQATWEFQGQPRRGTEHRYEAVDNNAHTYNHWEFLVRVPQQPGQVSVQPTKVPKSSLAVLERRAVVFVPATKRRHKRMLYAKLFVSDPSGKKNRIGLRGEDRHTLPNWFEYFGRGLRVKKTVTTTKGRDGESLVFLARPDDHERMIRLYFALRVWVLEERLSIR
jgi:hypothetical protein